MKIYNAGCARYAIRVVASLSLYNIQKQELTDKTSQYQNKSALAKMLATEKSPLNFESLNNILDATQLKSFSNALCFAIIHSKNTHETLPQSSTSAPPNVDVNLITSNSKSPHRVFRCLMTQA